MKKVTVLALTCTVGALVFAMSAAAAEKWPQESFSGKITMVDPAENLVVVKGPDQVPFDMIVTPSTRIKSGTQALSLKDLSQYRNQNVSVKFVPESRGDVAESIHING